MKQGDAAGNEELGIVDALVQVSFLVQTMLGRVVAQHDLSVIQLRLLGILRDREPAMQELARFLSLDKSSVSGLIDRAERRGLVRRTTTPADGRVIRVTLTPDGRRIGEAVSAEVARQIDGLVENLPAVARAQLAHLVSQILFADAGRHGVDLSTRGSGDVRWSD